MQKRRKTKNKKIWRKQKQNKKYKKEE